MLNRRLLLVAFFALVLLLPAYAADITGKWTAEIETPMGVMKYTYEFKVDGAQLTGKVSSQMGETEITEGKVDGDQITFVETMKMEDNAIRVEYKGKIQGDQIKFTRKVGDFANEEFVAKRA